MSYQLSAMSYELSARAATKTKELKS